MKVSTFSGNLLNGQGIGKVNIIIGLLKVYLVMNISS